MSIPNVKTTQLIGFSLSVGLVSGLIFWVLKAPVFHYMPAVVAALTSAIVVVLLRHYQCISRKYNLSLAILNSDTAVACLDNQLTIKQANAKLSSIIGYDKAQLMGKRITGLPFVILKHKLYAIAQSIAKQEHWRGEVACVSANGQRLTLSVLVKQLHNSLSQPDGYMVTFTDISEYKRRELYLKTLTETDPLTGCSNRRSFDRAIVQQLSQVKRAQDYHTSLAIIDIDHFKQINDQQGHEQGDKVLVLLSKLLKENLRDSDSISRIGGEEFALLMPGTNLVQAADVVVRLKRIIADAPNLSIIVSIGISELDHSVNSAMRLADEALYCAKGSGRNRAFSVSQTKGIQCCESLSAAA
ncbi:diguanylate cyclase [Shewanella maritima]|uniref:diguanylate cyclase n=1 Tax=Shewanella maritima TaxID=2520507 RepID=UPI0037365EDC